LDEADVLEYGIQLTAKCPPNYQGCDERVLFSATTSTSSTTANNFQEWMNGLECETPVWTDVAAVKQRQTMASDDVISERKHLKVSKSQATPSSLTNYHSVTNHGRETVQVGFMTSHPNEKMIVFFLTCMRRFLRNGTTEKKIRPIITSRCCTENGPEAT
jgi:hypothetical protein